MESCLTPTVAHNDDGQTINLLLLQSYTLTLVGKPMAKTMGKDKFRHTMVPKPLNGFRRNWEYITTFRVLP